MEFAHRLLQRGDRHLAGRSHPLRIARHLREDDDRGIARRILPDRRRKADVRREETVVASFARTMQKENRRPARLGGIIGRHVDLIVIRFSTDGDVAVEKSCLHLLQRTGNPKQQQKHGEPPDQETRWRSRAANSLSTTHTSSS